MRVFTPLGHVRAGVLHCAASDDDFSPFTLPTDVFLDFPLGSRVLDLGCGPGVQLAEVNARGCRAMGADVSLCALRRARLAGLRVIAARAEALPFRDRSFDGVLCKVVVPYTEEAEAVAEIARILRPGGCAILALHGAGYYLRYLLHGPSWRHRLYAARTFANTWVYVLARVRLPGFVGDTLYQSRQRLERYRRAYGLALRNDPPSRRFMGFPVFIYHTLERR